MAHQHIVGALNDARKRAEGARDGAIIAVGEDRTAADRIIGRRDVDGLLNVGTVEVVVRSTGQRGEAHFIPQERAEISQMVDIEARVDKGHGGDNVIPYITTL